MEHAERKGPLLARHLVVIELDGIDRSASELIVLGEWPEDGCQKYTGAGALGMLHQDIVSVPG